MERKLEGALLSGRGGLCGLAVFLQIFEARARYVYLYSPVFVILSVCGLEGLFLRIRKTAAAKFSRQPPMKKE